MEQIRTEFSTLAKKYEFQAFEIPKGKKTQKIKIR